MSRRRSPSWSFSIREAAEPEERAEEENWVGLKSGERKADKIGSEEKVSKGDEAEVCGVAAEEIGVAVVLNVVER